MTNLRHPGLDPGSMTYFFAVAGTVLLAGAARCAHSCLSLAISSSKRALMRPFSLFWFEMKRFCAENLPIYMLPDRFSWHDALPKTSTNKVDYQRLKAIE